MVKTKEQATRIQKKRRDAGKPGLAQAVRRFLKRTGRTRDCSLA